MVLGATLELTGTPREVRVGGAEGGAKDHRHTTGILLLVGTLSDKPPSSSTSPVAARGEKKKKKNLCWTIPIGLVCPLVPGLGPASLGLPGQDPSPDRRSLIYGGGRPSTPPDTAATSPRQADTSPRHQPKNAMRRRLQAVMESELSLFGELRGQLKLKISIKVAPP